MNEVRPTPCVVFGVDIGKPLYTLGVMGWLGIVTLPSGGIALVTLHGFRRGRVDDCTAKEKGSVARRKQHGRRSAEPSILAEM